MPVPSPPHFVNRSINGDGRTSGNASDANDTKNEPAATLPIPAWIPAAIEPACDSGHVRSSRELRDDME
ncbi:hypothetical protein AURDEDRAFT_174868 [Auricularia subglabra TFB-10046 SS5]|nr:hypothetical protein AURDEDRAFT_174868 [Auricularia subglabra TFB-10046 SS5]